MSWIQNVIETNTEYSLLIEAVVLKEHFWLGSLTDYDCILYRICLLCNHLNSHAEANDKAKDGEVEHW